VGDNEKENYSLEDVRTLVTAAATILKKMGSEKERIAWMLEDTLTYLDEMQADDGLESSKAVMKYLEGLEEDKAVNS